ncbi:MAG: HAMP domain-containing sensor histidine kinase [Candidatus Woesebacteria bacterium]|jgi:signal transduction histidine kinase
MAVKIHQFFKKHQSEAILFTVLLQLFVIALACSITWATWQYYHLNPLHAFVLYTFLLLTFEIIFVPASIAAVSRPFKILSQAVAHVSDDPVQTPPPDISSKEAEHTGLRAMVQTIYRLAAEQERSGQQKTKNLDSYKVIFDNSPVGIAAINAEGNIIAHNSLAPVRRDTNNQNALQLLFEQSNGLDSWLKNAKDNKVRDTKTWHRVADKIPGEEDRKIFDVIAYYNKNGESNVETILITVDRTVDYAPEDEDMDFVALAAHELRGPITVIRGYLDIMSDELESKLQPEQQELVDRLQVSAEQLSGYVNNILNVSRYDRNHLKLHLHEEKVIDIVQSMVPDLALRAKTKRRKLTFNIPQNLPTVAVDRSSVSEVLSNLIDNAIKYSYENGEVLVSAQQNGDFVEITVQDFGIGMPVSIVGNLFNKFYRSHRSRQQYSGTGLGLYICKAIVESHGGKIWVTSVEGQGSTFGFSLPVYSTVADKLGKSDNSNEQIIQRSDGWIKNHAMYRR